jgi:plasmid maintenance system antidote protein VapI
VNTRTSMKRRVVKFAKHPGLLVAEAIATRGVSAEQLAEKLHLELPQVEQLLQGQYAVDAQLAQELARTIGGTSAEWTARQRAHDEWRRYQEESGATAP